MITQLSVAYLSSCGRCSVKDWPPLKRCIHEQLFSRPRWCSRRNHVSQVSKWNFQGLRFYRGVEFSMFFIDFWMGFLTTVQRYCAACDVSYFVHVQRCCCCWRWWCYPATDWTAYNMEMITSRVLLYRIWHIFTGRIHAHKRSQSKLFLVERRHQLASCKTFCSSKKLLINN